MVLSDRDRAALTTVPSQLMHPRALPTVITRCLFCDDCLVWWDRGEETMNCWLCGLAGYGVSQPDWRNAYAAERLMAGPGRYIPGWDTLAQLEQDQIA